MGKFIAGIIIGIVGVAAGAYVFLHYGFMNMAADQPVNSMELFYMKGAMTRYSTRYAPKVQDPVPPTDDNLIAGIRLYKSNCAVCHGGPDIPMSDVGRGLYPPAPQFLKDAPDMPENQNYWIIKHGVARTGMLAWNKQMSDSDIWTIATFFSKMDQLDKLSAPVQQAWKTGGQTELGAQGPPQAAPAMPQPEHHQDHSQHE